MECSAKINQKKWGGKTYTINLRYYLGICPEGTAKTTKILREDCRAETSTRDLPNWGRSSALSEATFDTYLLTVCLVWELFCPFAESFALHVRSSPERNRMYLIHIQAWGVFYSLGGYEWAFRWVLSVTGPGPQTFISCVRLYTFWHNLELSTCYGLSLYYPIVLIDVDVSPIHETLPDT
jgi:hypothetical protein